VQVEVGPRAVLTVMDRVCVLLERERMAGWVGGGREDGWRERDTEEVDEGVGVVISGCEVAFKGPTLRSPAGGDPDLAPEPDED